MAGVPTPHELPRARVSVLLSSYNRRDYLALAIESALQQSFDDLHVLIVDDASRDGAADVARRYASRFPDRVSAICKPHRLGLAHSVNLGLSLMRESPYVAFLADDDLWHPSKLERQLEAFAADPRLGLVATEAIVIDDQGRPTGELFSDRHGRGDLDEPARWIFLKGNFLCAASVVASRAALELVDHRYPLDGTCNDMYMALVIAASMGVSWLAEPLTSYRRTASSLSVAREAQTQHETVVLRRYAFDRFPAVRSAVGGEQALRALERSFPEWAVIYLERRNLRYYLLYLRYTLRSHSPLRGIAVLAAATTRSLLYFVFKRLRR
jgi:glycosyltransferase involved in cell wall biosynthesis